QTIVSGVKGAAGIGDTGGVQSRGVSCARREGSQEALPRIPDETQVSSELYGVPALGPRHVIDEVVQRGREGAAVDICQTRIVRRAVVIESSEEDHRSARISGISETLPGEPVAEIINQRGAKQCRVP